jgi:uncharacterized protein YkwD
MRYLITFSLFILMTGIISSSLTINAAPLFSGCGSESVQAANTDFETQIVVLVNQRRAEQNLPPMKLNLNLANASRYHAVDMDADNYFQHDTYDLVNGELVKQCSWIDRIKVYYPSPRAENIAQGYTTPESVMRAWMNSTGHRNNILGDYREIGVGYYQGEWVQDFGTEPDVYPLIINQEAATTNSPNVTLYIYGEWTKIRLRNNSDGAWVEQPFSHDLNWVLNNTPGLQTVEAELSDGSQTIVVSDTIELLASTSTPTAPTATPTVVVTPNPDPGTHVFLPVVQR